MTYDDCRDAWTCPCGHVGDNGPANVSVASLTDVAAELEARGESDLAQAIRTALEEYEHTDEFNKIGFEPGQPMKRKEDIAVQVNDQKLPVPNNVNNENYKQPNQMGYKGFGGKKQIGAAADLIVQMSMGV